MKRGVSAVVRWIQGTLDSKRRLAQFPGSVVLVLATVLFLCAACTGSPPIEPPRVEPSYSIWPDDTQPQTPSAPDNAAVEVGLEFTVSSSGVVSGLRFYRAADNEGPHRGRLWSADGRLLGSVDFDNSTDVGWHNAALDEAVHVVQAETYTVSYTAPAGHYAADQDSLGQGRPVISRDLTALRGVFSYQMERPTQSFNDTNYYVDIVFRPDAAETTPAPTPSTSSPSPDSAPPKKDGPPMAGFPGPESTGVDGTALRKIDGDYHVTRSGTIVENLDIHGTLFIEAPDVTVRNTRVTCSGSWWVVQAKSPRVTIEDSTFTVDTKDPDNYCQYGIVAGDKARILRNDISNTPDGLSFVGDSAHVEDNWVHNQIAYPGKQDHVDAAQVNGGGAGPYVFRGNHFSVPGSQTGCLALFADFGPVQNVLADGNLFDGAGYAVYGGTASATNVRFTNNWFATSFYPKSGYWGPVTKFDATGEKNVWHNNRWVHSGKLIKPFL